MLWAERMDVRMSQVWKRCSGGEVAAEIAVGVRDQDEAGAPQPSLRHGVSCTNHR